tara:strand:- start:450 stop:623 length:174 start_codon:yes stop_codon:yes gene_type:complete
VFGVTTLGWAKPIRKNEQKNHLKLPTPELTLSRRVAIFIVGDSNPFERLKKKINMRT